MEVSGNVDPLEGPPYWEGSLDFAAWGEFCFDASKNRAGGGRGRAIVGLYM